MNAAQGTDAWRQERCGKVGASMLSSVLAKGQGKMRRAALRQVVAERLTGKPTETYQNAHMERGLIEESAARMSYEQRTGAIVQEVGFIPHPTLMCGCSPDGLVGDDGGVEIKSVIPTVHVETMLAGEYPSEHRAQIQGSLWITGRAWWDFCSFCADMPEHLQLYVFRVWRDEDYIKMLAAEVAVFLSEADALTERLLKRSA